MDLQLTTQIAETDEITFAELTALVKAELQINPDSNCIIISEKYGISITTMSKLIKQIKLK